MHGMHSMYMHKRAGTFRTIADSGAGSWDRGWVGMRPLYLVVIIVVVVGVVVVVVVVVIFVSVFFCVFFLKKCKDGSGRRRLQVG